MNTWEEIRATCPFCDSGNVDVAKFAPRSWVVECGVCFAYGPRCDTKREAIRLWEQRLGGDSEGIVERLGGEL